MHDGLSLSPNEAVLRHGREAAAVTSRYRQLPVRAAPSCWPSWPRCRREALAAPTARAGLTRAARPAHADRSRGGNRPPRRASRGPPAPPAVPRRGRPPRRPRRGRPRAGSSRVAAPERARARSKRRGSGFSTPSSCESRMWSKCAARPRRSSLARTVPLAFDTTTSRRPRRRKRTRASSTSPGTDSHRLCSWWYARSSARAAVRGLAARDAGVGEHQMEVEPAPPIVGRAAHALRGVQLALGVGLRGREPPPRRRAHPVPSERLADALPVRDHEHAAGVEEEGLDGHLPPMVYSAA